MKYRIWRKENDKYVRTSYCGDKKLLKKICNNLDRAHFLELKILPEFNCESEEGIEMEKTFYIGQVIRNKVTGVVGAFVKEIKTKKGRSLKVLCLDFSEYWAPEEEWEAVYIERED